jgi:hypothetical protein
MVDSKKRQAAGKHHFEASSRGTKGCSGDAELEKFNRYTWTFYIRQVSRHCHANNEVGRRSTP